MSPSNFEEVVLDCPKCKEHSLVRLQHSTEDVFECVYCHHRENLTKDNSPRKTETQDNTWATILAILFSLAMVLPFLAAL